MKSEKAYQKAKKVIEEFFSDSTQTTDDTREGLEALQSDIEMMLESLPESEEDD